MNIIGVSSKKLRIRMSVGEPTENGHNVKAKVVITSKSTGPIGFGIETNIIEQIWLEPVYVLVYESKVCFDLYKNTQTELLIRMNVCEN